VEARSAAPAPLVIASAVRRIAASAVDFLLVAAVDVAVLYFTLAVTGLSLIDIFVIPAVPMLAFLMLLNGGYLVAFIAASGQTIGKMLTGIRVVNHDGGRVDVPGALLRAAGVLLAVVTFGLPYLPVLVSGEKRALHDRLAGTRVIRHV
jgi:uncharacterized RDD family membrane protein YckC